MSVTATSEATATTIVSASAHTYEAVPHLIEFFSPNWTSGAAVYRICLFDGSTSQGFWSTGPASTNMGAMHLFHVLTPSAASHTYSVRAFHTSAATGTMTAGAGGAAAAMNGFIHITRIPT